ncbi:MAG TPA: carbon-nitrogen hydrolase family protein [Chloroflexota bacterium]|nr:carbon-nitrogen hydrolase family protein [Chloroflexota bacterium]
MTDDRWSAPQPTAPGVGVPVPTVAPWICRAAITPRVWTEGADEALWTESNGSAGCYGGWELRYAVAAGATAEWRFELAAVGTDLLRGADEVVVEAYWYGPTGVELDWDPVFLETCAAADDTAGPRLHCRFARRLRQPPGATQLGIRCGLRWSSAGRVRWRDWRLQPVSPNPPRMLRLGVASRRPPQWTGPEANARHYHEQCKQAGEAGIDLVCLPETILTWGCPDGDPSSVHRHAVPLHGAWLEPFQQVAQAYRMGICFSVNERAGVSGEVVYNTALLLGRDGALTGTYRKVHLALGEVRQGVTAGQHFPVHEFDGIRVGMLICMDSAASEASRMLAVRGAEVVLMPIMGDFRATSWVQGDAGFHRQRWELAQLAHAFDNHLYLVAARNGNEGSMIAAPWGETIAANDGSRDVIWADVNVDDHRPHWRGSTMEAVLRSMRRPALYGDLSSALPTATAASPARPTW